MALKKNKFKKDHNGKYREIRKESLKDSLSRLIKFDANLEVKNIKVDDELNKKWQKIVGKKLGNLSVVKSNKSGSLTIEAENNIVIQELKMYGANFFIQQFKSGDDIYAFNKIIFKIKK